MEKEDIAELLEFADKKNSITDLDVARKMINLKQSADSRNLKFDLSFMKLKSLMEQKKCFYTGKPFDKTPGNELSIDRVDNRIGYVDDNIVACTVEINRKKTDISIEEIEMLYKAIKRTKKGYFKDSPDSSD